MLLTPSYKVFLESGGSPNYTYKLMCDSSLGLAIIRGNIAYAEFSEGYRFSAPIGATYCYLIVNEEPCAGVESERAYLR